MKLHMQMVSPISIQITNKLQLQRGAHSWSFTCNLQGSNLSEIWRRQSNTEVKGSTRNIGCSEIQELKLQNLMACAIPLNLVQELGLQGLKSCKLVNGFLVLSASQSQLPNPQFEAENCLLLRISKRIQQKFRHAHVGLLRKLVINTTAC